ncbi:hypothetical protein ACFX15_045223 [Malus domestica]
MADYSSLLIAYDGPETASPKPSRVASLDVFRDLCVFLMMLVDYGSSILPIIAHSPWNGLHLADFVMPFFLFIAGVSLALVYKRVTNRVEATWKAVFKAVKLFLLGVMLQGGYFHGVTSLTYGVDIERIRWSGILQRIAIGYIAAALCEIWLSRQTLGEVGFFRIYYWHWCVIFSLSAIYAGVAYLSLSPLLTTTPLLTLADALEAGLEGPPHKEQKLDSNSRELLAWALVKVDLKAQNLQKNVNQEKQVLSL